MLWLNDGMTQDEGYRLSELSERSATSERTIRFYQAEKLLPRPGKRGRQAVYDDEHVERLALIAELRDHGMSLNTIRALVSTDQPTRTVAEWMGVDATLSAPWSDDRPRTVGQDELEAMLVDAGVARAGLIAELTDQHYVTPLGDGRWEIASPALLDGGLRLLAAGVAVDISAQLRDLLRRRLAKAVDDSVKMIVARAGSGFAGSGSVEELAAALGALRPVARETASVILAQEVERALAALLDSGPQTLVKRA